MGLTSTVRLRNLYFVLHVVFLAASFCRLLIRYFVGIFLLIYDANYPSNCDVMFLSIERLLLMFVLILLLLWSLL